MVKLPYGKSDFKALIEGANQIDKYINDYRLDTSRLKKYVVVFAKDEVKVIKEL